MKRIVLLFFICSICSCSQKTFDDKDELIDYLKEADNGYFKMKSLNGIDISLMYSPTDLIVSREVNDSISNEQIENLRKEYDKFVYFNLNISKNNKELLSSMPKDIVEFSALANQLSFKMGDQLHLFTSKKDTINLIDYVYPRMYGLGRTTSFLLVYPRKEIIEDPENITLVIKDFGLKTGEIKFKILTSKITNEPRLKFN